MKNIRTILLLIVLGFSLNGNALTLSSLADSLAVFASQRAFVGKVEVKKFSQNGTDIRVYTNMAFSYLSLSPDEIQDLKRLISLWIRNDEKGKVKFYTNNIEIEDLITSRFRPRSHNTYYTANTLSGKGLDSTHIALMPSHGIFYDYNAGYWHWQRARMWGIVEDIYTTQYNELVATMLENAGATIYCPRPRQADSAAHLIGESGLPRWMEGACYWLKYKGYPESIWNTTPDAPNDYINDMRCRGNWVNYINDSIHAIDLCLALHTDGLSYPDDSSIVGTLAIYTEFNDRRETLYQGKSRKQNRDLADWIQTQLVEDIQKTTCPIWQRRELKSDNYCETRYPNVPSIILEILSHKSRTDMQYGLDPKFQHLAARAIYKGILRYLHTINGTTPVIQPLHPIALHTAYNEHKNLLTLTWKEQVDTLEETATPSEYSVFLREDDKDWEELGTYRKTSCNWTPKKDVTYSIKVVAQNKGGKSMDSEILAAYIPSEIAHRMLVVNAFTDTRGPEWFLDSLHAGIVPHRFAVPDGIDRGYLGEQMNFNKQEDWVSDDECGLGMCYSNYLGKAIVGNTHDYPTWRLATARRHQILLLSCSAEALDSLPHNTELVEIILGKEKNLPSLTPILQSYIQQGGRVLVSGSYLPAAPYIRAHNASTDGRIILCDSLATSFTFSPLPNERSICAEDVTGLKSCNNGTILARYPDTHLGAAELWTTSQGGKCLLWGLPLESIFEFDNIYDYSIQVLIQ